MANCRETEIADAISRMLLKYSICRINIQITFWNGIRQLSLRLQFSIFLWRYSVLLFKCFAHMKFIIESLRHRMAASNVKEIEHRELTLETAICMAEEVIEKEREEKEAIQIKYEKLQAMISEYEIMEKYLKRIKTESCMFCFIIVER